MKSPENLHKEYVKLKEDKKNPILSCANRYADSLIKLGESVNVEKMGSLMKEGCKLAKLNAGMAIFNLDLSNISCDCEMKHYEAPR